MGLGERALKGHTLIAGETFLLDVTVVIYNYLNGTFMPRS